MKNRPKGFAGISRKALWYGLFLAAAITVYGFAQAATVSHAPSEIIPQGAGSTLDSDYLQGLSAADMLSASSMSAGTLWIGADCKAARGCATPPCPSLSVPACPQGYTQLAYVSGNGYSSAFLSGNCAIIDRSLVNTGTAGSSDAWTYVSADVNICGYTISGASISLIQNGCDRNYGIACCAYRVCQSG